MLRSRAAYAALVFTILLMPVPAGAQTPTRQQTRELTNELSSVFGTKLAEIDFENEDAELHERLASSLPLKVGAEITRADVRNSIKALFATGYFSDVQVRSEATFAGTKLIFTTKPAFFIGQVIVEGAPGPPTASQVAAAAKLELGLPFTEEAAHVGLERVKKLLEDNGYYKNEVKVDYEFQKDLQQVNVRYSIQPGPVARVGAVLVKGNAGFTESKVQDIAKMHPGDKVSAARVTRALQRLRKKYQKQKQLEAQVAITDKTYHPETNTLDYTFALDHGAKIDVKVEGASVRSGLIKRYVPIYEENAVDDDLLNEGRRNFRDYFQTQGYFDAGVEYTQTSDSGGDHRTITYDINKGERHKLTDLTIQGNKYFDVATIRERMNVTPATLFQYHGKFSQALLARDVAAIEALYRANGFQQVLVSTNVDDDYKAERGRMLVVVQIEEGPQTLVNKVEITGNNAYSDEEITNLLSIIDGQPYSESNVATDREAVLNFYFNRGFPDVKFEAKAEKVSQSPPRVNVTYTISEGSRAFVNKVLLTGLHNTHRYVVDREIQIKNGDPLSQSDMLETQRRLYDLGIFNSVNVAVQNPNGDAAEKNVLINVEEAKRYTFNYGVGLEVQTGDITSSCIKNQALNPLLKCQPQGRTGVSPRVSFDVTRINFLGRDHTLVFKSRYGRLQQRALFSYEAPRWFNNENMKLTFTTFFDKTQDVRTFTAERLEGSAQIEHKINRGTTLLYRITYRRVQVDPTTLQVSANDIPLLSRPVRVGFPSITYLRDTRDDPIESKRGAYTTVDLGVASGIFGSESSFVRFVVANSTYHAFKARKWVLARSLRIGVEKDFGDISHAFVPLPERFFAGGSNSHRGFSINQAGPRDLDTGFPLGGNAVFVNNIELRTPPITLPYLDDNLSAVIFHDAGNVFAQPRDMLKGLIRFSQPNSSSCRSLSPAAGCDFAYLAHSVGAGLRYKTPIGPVRVDFGWALNPTKFPIKVESRSDTLRRFNVFFSIGQTF